MDIIILIVGLIILRVFQSKDKIGYDKIAIVVAIYFGYTLLCVVFESRWILLLIVLILWIQNILFKYRSTKGMLVYTLIYFVIISYTGTLLGNINSYFMSSVFSGGLEIIITIILFLLVGYVNIKDYERNKRAYKFYVLGAILGILLLNSYVYSQFYIKEIDSNVQVVQIDSCDKLSSLESNNKYELSQDLDCNGDKISNKNRFIPYVIEINGNGYKVSNASIEGSLVNKINAKSSISNIRFEDVDINGEGIVEGNYGSIKQVAVVNSDITSTSRGGLVGYNARGGHISNSYSAGNNIIGERQVGGIAGENYGGIDNTYSTSYVEGYEYVGGLVGHNVYPGYIDNSFYDDIGGDEVNESNNISKGALEIIGQDRKTREVMEDKEEGKEKILEEGYESDTQKWYTESMKNNVVVLSNDEYQEYQDNKIVIEGKPSTISDLIAFILEFFANVPGIGPIIDELTEVQTTFNEIKVLPYSKMYNDEVDGTTGNTYLEDDYGFSSDTWDYSSLTEESIGTSEPIKLKGM